VRYAIITPYHKEPPSWLQRCIDSVRRQTVPADHILVADGHAQDWLGSAGVRHLVLDRAHGNFGNTPRAIGAMLAIGEQYDGFGFLDADNWLEPDHIAACLDTMAEAPAPEAIDYIIARRCLRRPDETIMPIADRPVEEHVDTNCFFFLPGAYHAVPYFGTMPPELSAACDRVFYQMLRSRGLNPAVSTRITVNYLCTYEVFYRALGETPPDIAKPNVDSAALNGWLAGLAPARRLQVQRLIGLVP
jgi:glycosyltransferase involved in cell wall biosynthesis